MSSGNVARRRMRDRRAPKEGGLPWWAYGLLAVLGLGVLSVAAGVGTVFAVYQHYADDYVPIETKLQQRNVGLTTIFDRGGVDDGVQLGVLANPDAQLLQPVPLSEISDAMIEATVSTEDNEFWNHDGFSITGILRAGYENYVKDSFGSGSGGSTITQQLVKNVYICPSIADDTCVAERSLDRKLRELAYAIELEQDYEKEQILGWYLNQISYADRYVGVQAAAEGYFRVDASALTLAQAAMLAGIPAAPTSYHPRLNCVEDPLDPDVCAVDALGRSVVGHEAKERQEHVLDLMVDHGRATPSEVAAAKEETLYVYANSDAGTSTAFIDNQVEPRLVRMCKAGVLPKLEGVDDCEASVHSAGWKVTTTLDHKETQVAQIMIRGMIDDGLANGCDCHNAAIVTIEPSTGQLLVYAPNRDPSFTSDDRVRGDIDQLVEINQPGSSFKPIVYLTWFDVLGKAPMSTFWDTSPLTIEGTDITNPRGAPYTEGLISARAALGGSQNVGAFRAALEAGPDNVIAMAKQMGITTLDQYFDPTFAAHEDVTYGASIATGGANIRAVDLAYANATISNMGTMVGVPHYAEYIEVDDMISTWNAEGESYEKAVQQKADFTQGNVRLPDTRALDPVVILQVQDIDGNVIFTQGEPERVEVVDPGSVWLLHSIMTDCNARFIIWGCGGSNTDLSLDAHDLDGRKIPTGIKTGTQQGPLSAVDTLETWMNGFSRYAATAVWVGNADNQLVLDGPSHNYAAANTTTTLFKSWMGEYHDYLRRNGIITGDYQGWDDMQPGNVVYGGFKTASTDRNLSGGCDQSVSSWYRTDVDYEDPCYEVEIDTRNGLLATSETPSQFRESRRFIPVPDFKPELAIALAANPPYGPIPLAPTEESNGESALAISSPQTGDTISHATAVTGSVNLPDLTSWLLEIAPGSNPGEGATWIEIGSGDSRVTGQLGIIDPEALEEPGIYTVRLTASGGSQKDLRATVLVNVRLDGVDPDDPDPDADATPTVPPGFPTRTPSPTPGIIIGPGGLPFPPTVTPTAPPTRPPAPIPTGFPPTATPIP